MSRSCIEPFVPEEEAAISIGSQGENVIDSCRLFSMAM